MFFIMFPISERSQSMESALSRSPDKKENSLPQETYHLLYHQTDIERRKSSQRYITDTSSKKAHNTKRIPPITLQQIPANTPYQGKTPPKNFDSSHSVDLLLPCA